MPPAWIAARPVNSGCGRSGFSLPFFQFCTHFGGTRRFDFSEDLQGCLGAINRLPPMMVQCKSRIEQGSGFPASVADLTGDHQLLLEKSEGAAGVAQFGVSVA